MTLDQRTVSVHDVLWELTDSDSVYVNRTFQSLRTLSPDVVTHACLYYLAEKGLTPLGQEMAAWLSLDNRYFTPLFDEASLPLAVAIKAVAALSKADLEISLKFLEAVEPSPPPTS
jgi:hypothetical protein